MTGRFKAAAVTLANSANGTGVFSNAKTYGSSQTSNNSIGGGDVELPFDASNSSALFGASDTVQPAGLYGQYIIRYV